MPDIISGDLNVADIFATRPDAIIYYPVFYGSTGWWGELLGGAAMITNKLIISPECQLMVIESASATRAKRHTTHHLFAAEIYPTSGFFKKMSSEIATVADMLATDAGTILALFSGRDKNRFVNVLESTGNAYLGCIGQY